MLARRRPDARQRKGPALARGIGVAELTPGAVLAQRHEAVEHDLPLGVPWVDDKAVDADGERLSPVVAHLQDGTDQLLLSQDAPVAETDRERGALDLHAGNRGLRSRGHRRLEWQHNPPREPEPVAPAVHFPPR